MRSLQGIQNDLEDLKKSMVKANLHGLVDKLQNSIDDLETYMREVEYV